MPFSIISVWDKLGQRFLTWKYLICAGSMEAGGQLLRLEFFSPPPPPWTIFVPLALGSNY